MRLTEIRAVLLDLDGTLVDSAPDLAVAVNATLAELDRPPHSVDTIRDWVGNGADRLLERALSGHFDGRLPPDQLAALRPRFLYHYEQRLCVDSTLYPGVAEGLEMLRHAGLRLACVTNKPSRFIRPLLERLNIADRFGAMVGGDDAPRKKPDPAPLRLAAERLDVGVTHCLMVGDSVNDIEAARAADCPVVVVPYGYNHGQDIREAHPDAVIDSLTRLPPLLREAA
jgi:phosphoglycolate phosphatase